jgi:putative oxidoreductase
LPEKATPRSLLAIRRNFTLRFLDRLQPLALLVLRMVLGVIMMAHGHHKVFGDLSQHMGTVSRMGFPSWFAYLSAGTEFFGGIFIIAGLLTRLVGAAMTFEMMVAVIGVHLKNGLVGNGGYEFPLSLAAMSFALLFFGGGPIALDAVIWGRGGGKKAR